ncbi:hypothetical protein [Candidatus Magnetobacterium casense]|uniref:hypothetical protein n=1 Tax=Candidatus Magnetobacterium casense TaxID=1455061 RepID=UPI00058F07D6|nr:hypothetical protein [Candidatus Magnetobacterium casensis]
MSKTIELYNLLKDKIGEEATSVLINAFDEGTEKAKTEAATKADLQVLKADTKADVQVLRTELKTDIQALRTEMQALRTELQVFKTDIEGKLEAKLAELKADILKWTFLFWTGQLVAMAALLKFFGGH